ncbi:hypothetical protein LTR08_002470 [Meristemomyces frigidus]|nr:hypothetical protein LTR08_002470 [Meristemomyces frigidus]
MTEQEPLKPAVPSSIGRKRPRLEFDADTVSENAGSQSEHLTPRTTPCCPSPNSSLQFYDDDCHEEYEWVRLPKKRNFDLFQAARLKPEDRNMAERSHEITSAHYDRPRHISTPWSRAPPNHHSVDITFTAGKSHKLFEKVNFLVVLDEVEQSARDGVPNVILGYEFLKTNDMLMIDLDYCNDADPELEVIADKAENENGSTTSILPFAAQVRGIPHTQGVVRGSVRR